MPSYVSEIVEVNTYADLPQPGQSNVIYVVKTPSVTTYRWTGSTYITVDEKAQYYSIEVDSSNVVTMGDLRTYVENVSNTGLHCFFDFSDFITNARTCTVLCFTQSAVNYCVIFDIINGRTYVDYSGYQDSETVQAYVNRLGDDIPRVISITDANTTVQDIVNLLNDVNVIGHHILFDFHTLQANCYLCSVSYSSNNIVITDIVGCKVGKATFDANTLLLTVLAGMGEVVDTASAQTISGEKTFNTQVNFNYANFTSYGGLKTSGGDVLIFKSGKIFVYRTIVPNTTNYDLGDSTYKWGNLYLTGGFNPNTNGYKLTLPDTTNFTADSEIIDTASAQTITGAKTFTSTITSNQGVYFSFQGFHGLINIDGINLQIRADQGDIGLRPNGSVRPWYNNTTLLGNPSYQWKEIYVAGNISDGTNSVSVAHLAQNTPTQWYGTQAQYDALSSYDSNTIYNILES